MLRVVLDGNPNRSEATELPLPDTDPEGSLVKFELKENCPRAVGLWKGSVCRRRRSNPNLMLWAPRM